MKFPDLLLLSLRTLRANRLRSGITVAIIALGITALIGIITAVEAMNQKLTESFASLGANGFTIRYKEAGFRIGTARELKIKRRGGKQEKAANLGQPITVEQAEAFRRLFQYPATVGLSCSAGSANNVSTPARQTNPTVSVIGGDENNVELYGNEIAAGRNFSGPEVAAGSDVCILGHDVASKLFGDDDAAALNKDVRIKEGLYKVVAVLKSRGATFGFSRDNLVLIPYKNAVRNFSYASFNIAVKAPGVTRVEEAMGEAEGAFRTVRGLAATEESNFVLERSNSLAEKAISSLRYLTAAVTIIGLITLIGAAIGLMNIMLVAVTERTKEVGLIKAIGGKRRSIHKQFLLEAVALSLTGAVIGIAAGIALGNLFGVVLQTRFVVPWNWILYGIIICTTVGLAAGSYPALKAGRLNPIDALRYE